MIRNFDEIIKMAQVKGRKIIAVAVAQDIEVLRAIKTAKDLGIADAILVGNEEEIRQIAQIYHMDIHDFTILGQNDHMEACRLAVKLISTGQAQVLMKGMVDTAILLKAVLENEIGLRRDKILSHVAIVEINGYDRLFYITDAAMNIAPDLRAKKQIIENGVQIARALGNHNPKVACICAVEKENFKMQATLDAIELVKMNETGELKDCLVAGPLALDNAVSLEAAQHKRITAVVAGYADILLMPSIEAGNILYKSIVFFAKGNVAGIIVGAKVPIVLTSRADSDHAKLNSIAIAVLMASKSEEKSYETKL